nr:TetR family transcriptional regulator [Egibacter rhizosphaerae]
MARTGRRPGNVDTRSEILAAARQQFAVDGFSGATIRRIAAAAGVDPALVHHYFGNKRQLFVASLELPFDPTPVVGSVLPGEAERAGERLVRTLLEVWGTDNGQAMMQSLLRSALTDEQVMRTLREFMLETMVSPLVVEIAPDQHRFRTTLLASQVMGLAILRHVARVEPLASADPEMVVAAVAPTLQRYLSGDVGGA